MIIMVNGAFGVGKTTIANKLVNEIKNSMIYDPEVVGFMLREIIPDKIKQIEAESGDFQDLELWKELTVHVAKRIVDKYKMNLIVPMTIRKPEYFQFIKEGFQRIDQVTYHFCLVASRETIHARLKGRGEEEGNWCFQQTEKCIKAYEEYNFEEYIHTENSSISEITEIIKGKLDI